MLTGLITLHIAICILLTVVVLVQFGKGAEAGAMMGGGGSSQAVFTSSSKGNFFTKLTTFLAIAFMVNSVILTAATSKQAKESIFDGEAPIAAPLNSDSKTAPVKAVTPAKTAPVKKAVKAKAAPANSESTKK
jgi:preprotein translocase subunit SecG